MPSKVAYDPCKAKPMSRVSLKYSSIFSILKIHGMPSLAIVIRKTCNISAQRRGCIALGGYSYPLQIIPRLVFHSLGMLENAEPPSLWSLIFGQFHPEASLSGFTNVDFEISK
jgi:hypothetical protein